MSEREHFAQDSLIAKQWQPSLALGIEAKESLYEMNEMYLRALCFSGIPARSKAHREEYGCSLSNIDPANQALISRCPFSLFNAKFEDGRFWTGQIRVSAIEEPMQRHLNFSRNYSDLTAFSYLALMYAWHMVRSNQLAARIFLGMEEETLMAFKRLSLSRIQWLAGEQPQLVTLRWPDRAYFWQNLLEVVQRGSMEALENMRLLGIQMVASGVAQHRSG